VKARNTFWSASVVGLAAGVGLTSGANATPYAFAGDQISNLTITYADQSSITPSTATTTISDEAQFGGYGISSFQTGGTVGSASTISQAYSGPGPSPSVSYTPEGAGTFSGARSDAAFAAGSLSTGSGIGFNNVAEAYGAGLGNSSGTNSAGITFTVTGTGEALDVSFNDLIQLIASTLAVPGETAAASIQNSFSLTPEGASTPLFIFSPTALNQQVSSTQGVPPSDDVGPTTVPASFATPVLMSGVMYTLTLTSMASETIQAGSTPAPLPEPASFAVLIPGLVAAGLCRRQRS